MPRKQLSMETREGIVRAYKDHRPITQIAQFFGLNDSSVRTFLQRYRESGTIKRGKQDGTRYSMIQDQHLNWLSAELDKYSNKTIEALRHGLMEAFPADFALRPPSSTTVWRAVTNSLRYRLKVLHVEPIDYNLAGRKRDRKNWCEDFQRRRLDLRDCVFIDESGFNLHVTNTYGRAAIGHRPITIRPSARGTNVTLVLAMSAHGILAYDTIQGSFNADCFIAFLRDKLFPRLQKPEMLIMDNAKVHRARKVKAFMETSEHVIEFLPSYLPYLNASEWVFGFMKPRCTRQNFLGPRSLKGMIWDTLWTVDSRQCQGWIDAVNENFLLSLREQSLGRTYQLSDRPSSTQSGRNNDDRNNQDRDDEDDDDDKEDKEDDDEDCNNRDRNERDRNERDRNERDDDDDDNDDDDDEAAPFAGTSNEANALQDITNSIDADHYRWGREEYRLASFDDPPGR